MTGIAADIAVVEQPAHTVADTGTGHQWIGQTYAVQWELGLAMRPE